MRKRIPFDIECPVFSDYNKLEIRLGNDVNIMINLKWEFRTHKNSQGKEVNNYKLISIN